MMLFENIPAQNSNLNRESRPVILRTFQVIWSTIFHFNSDNSTLILSVGQFRKHIYLGIRACKERSSIEEIQCQRIPAYVLLKNEMQQPEVKFRANFSGKSKILCFFLRQRVKNVSHPWNEVFQCKNCIIFVWFYPWKPLFQIINMNCIRWSKIVQVLHGNTVHQYYTCV